MGELREFLLARLLFPYQVEYQVSFRLLGEDAENLLLLDSQTKVGIEPFVEPSPQRDYVALSLKLVEMVLYDTHSEVELAFDLSKVNARVCPDVLKYLPSSRVLNLFHSSGSRQRLVSTRIYGLLHACISSRMLNSIVGLA